MSHRRTLLLPIVSACLLLLLPGSLRAAATLALFGTFHAMGVVVDIGATDDPDMDAQATVRWRVGDAGPLHQGYPLARVSATRFVGSLFRLRPGISHEVRIELVPVQKRRFFAISASACGFPCATYQSTPPRKSLPSLTLQKNRSFLPRELRWFPSRFLDGNELSDPDSPVTRDQMAVFLVTTFDLAGGAPTPPADPEATSPDGGR